MKIQELLNAVDGANITLSVTPEDLKEFAIAIIDGLKTRESECHSANNDCNGVDELLNQEQVVKYLKITKATLWRWRKIGYIEPTTYVGSRPLYRKSELDKKLKLKMT